MKKTLNLFSSAASYRRHYFDGSPVSFFFNTRLELVGKMLEGTNAKKMLDIGCGPGVAFSAIVPNGVHYFGADSSKPMIEKCCELYHDNEFVPSELLGMLRPAPENWSRGAATCTKPRADRACAAAHKPGDWIPSSLVSRISVT